MRISINFILLSFFIIGIIFLSKELNFILASIYLIALMIGNKLKLPYTKKTKKLSKSIIFLVFVMIISTLINQNSNPYLIFKDLYQYSYPLIILLIANLISKKIDYSNLSKFIIYFSFVLSILHLLYIIFILKLNLSLILEDEFDFYYKGIFQSLGLYFSLKVYLKNKNLFFLIIIFLISISILFHFSRTSLFFLFLALFYNLKNSSKKFTTLLILISSVFLVSVISDGSKFVEKIKRIPTEIFSFNDFNSLNIESDKVLINSNWRSYEAFMAINQVITGDSKNIFIGYGLGSLVDLGFYQNLGNNSFRYINKLHNAFAELFFKSGLIGLMIIIIFSYNLAFNFSKFSNFTVDLKFMGLSLFLSTFVIGGLFSKGELVLFFLFYCLLFFKENK